MKTLIFDGSHAGDPLSAKISATLQARLPDAETVVLRQQRIGNCAGDFFCWVRSPGLCNTNDDNRLLAARVMRSDLLVYLTPVTFGGYASALKRMVDHQIQNILPFFASVKVDKNHPGEIHHQPRYRRYPNLLVVGWMPAGTEHPAVDARAEAIFRHLVYRNAINFYAQKSACGVLVGNPTEAELSVQAGSWIEALERPAGLPAPALPEIPVSPAGQAPRRAVLLVGSPRTRKSTSASLGGYLFEQLAARGVQTETIQVYPAFSSPVRAAATLEKLDAADLVVLASPLYVDSLPAPTIAALEKIAAGRGGRSTGQRFAAIANCGFPEASHNAPALAICSEFARQSGFAWSGGLALGGGEGVVHGTPLQELDGRAIPIRKSLELAAEALAGGESIPQEARDLLTRPTVPSWLYRLVGAYGWRQRAKQYGMQRKIKDRPYEPVSA
ncbi:MAG: NAD(P)H-dependent oxidoreductase [Anaerolineales bacterium]